MLITKNAPRINAAASACPRRGMAEGLKTIAQKSLMTARLKVTPFSTLVSILKPVGVCCHELAMMIQTDEKIAPRLTMQVEKKCIVEETRSQPKTSTDRNPDSRKKAKMP